MNLSNSPVSLEENGATVKTLMSAVFKVGMSRVAI